MVYGNLLVCVNVMQEQTKSYFSVNIWEILFMGFNLILFARLRIIMFPDMCDSAAVFKIIYKYFCQKKFNSCEY